MQTMYPGMVNSPTTELASAIDDSQTTIEVINGAALPDAPNIASIGDGEDSETILYESKTGNVLSDVTRGFQGTAIGRPAGFPVSRLFTAYDLDALINNITSHDTEIVDARQPETGEAYPVLGARLDAIDARIGTLAIDGGDFLDTYTYPDYDAGTY